MKQTRNISLAGIGFCLDDDAYQNLAQYLESLHAHYDSQAEGAEVIADIEARIAELILSEQSYTRVVSAERIASIIAQLGTPDGEPYTPQPKASIPRRLHRWSKGRMLGGVCVGMGHYWNQNPMWFRVAFFVPFILMLISNMTYDHTRLPLFSTIAEVFEWLWLVMTFVYIALWVVIPMARTPRQKLEGRGEPITSESIHREFQQDAQPTPEGRMQASRDAEMVDEGRNTIRLILRVLAGLGATWLLISWICAMGTLLIAQLSGEMLMFDTVGSPFDVLGFGMMFVWFIIAIISLPWLILIYLLYCFAFGGRIRKWGIISIIILWIAALVLLGVKASQTYYCSNDGGKALREKLKEVKEQLGEFDDSVIHLSLEELGVKNMSELAGYITIDSVNGQQVVRQVISGYDQQGHRVYITCTKDHNGEITSVVEREDDGDISPENILQPNNGKRIMSFRFGPLKFRFDNSATKWEILDGNDD